MPFSSPYPNVAIPKTNILSYLFPDTPSADPLWLDSKDPSNSLSPAQLLQWVRRLGYGLQHGLGLARGDVVLICTPNHIFVPVAYLGIVGAGFIFSGANPAYTVPELVHQLRNTTAKAILVHPSMLPLILPAAEKAGLPQSRIFQFSDQPNPTTHGIEDWRDMIGSDAQGTSWTWPSLEGSEAASTVATINYSSGTTGLPKGVCVSHFNLVANVAQTIYMRYTHKPFAFEARPQERWIGFLPLYHAYGQLYTMLMAVRLAVPVYIMSEFRYEDFLHAIGRYRITSLQVAPPILVMLSKRRETARYDLSSVRDVLCGAAPLSRELQNEVQRRFDVQVNQGWGMTEVTCGALHVPGGIKDDSGSVGRLDPNCECRLVDDEGKEVGVGTRGEIHIRGPNVCMGYWRNEAATKESIDGEGWLKTGDIAVCDDQGYFWIVDRKKVRLSRGVTLQIYTNRDDRSSSRSMLCKWRQLSLKQRCSRTRTLPTPRSLVSHCKRSLCLQDNMAFMLTHPPQERKRVAAGIRRRAGHFQGQGDAGGYTNVAGWARGQAQEARGRRRLYRRGAQAGERQDPAQDDAGVGEEGCAGD